MIEKKEIIDLVNGFLVNSECYLVDVSVAPDNLIVVEIDHDNGVAIDDCVALSRYMEDCLDRDVEDFELEVTSAGITSPFKTVRQYLKNVGKEVEIMLKNGGKHSGRLKAANEEEFVVTLEKQIKPEGAKRKQTIREDETFRYEEIKYTKNIIRFK